MKRLAITLLMLIGGIITYHSISTQQAKKQQTNNKTKTTKKPAKPSRRVREVLSMLDDLDIGDEELTAREKLLYVKAWKMMQDKKKQKKQKRAKRKTA